MVVTMLTGWSGRMQAMPLGGPWGGHIPLPARRESISPQEGDGLTCTLQWLEGERVVLTAASADLTFSKTVSADGRSEALCRAGGDTVTLATGPMSVTIRRGGRVIGLDLSTAGPDRLLRVRRLLLTSAAVRSLRALAAQLEDAGASTTERLSVRLTAALVAHLDGDDGAFRRLAREMVGHVTSAPRATSTPEDQALYYDAVLKAAADLRACGISGSAWNPLPAVSGLQWLLQMERAWFRHLAHAACSQSSPPTGAPQP